LSFVYMLAVSTVVYLRNRSRLNNRVFAFLTFCVAFWMSMIFLRNSLTSINLLTPLYKWGFVSGGLTLSAILYFALVFPESKDTSRLLKSVLILAFLVMACLELFTNAIFIGYSAAPNGQRPIPILGNHIYIYTFYSSALLLLAVLTIFYKLFKTTGKGRSQVILLAIALAFGAGMAQFFALILPLYGLNDLEPFAPISVIVSVSIIGYAVLKYGLFAVSPSIAATELLNSLKQPFIICGLDGSLLYQNAAASQLDPETNKEIIDNVIKKGGIKRKLLLSGRILQVAAAFLKEGGAIAAIFEDITEIEHSLDRENTLYTRLERKLRREKELEEALLSIAVSSGAQEVNRNKYQNLDNEAREALNRLSGLVLEKFRLIEDAKMDKMAVEERLKEAEKLQRQNVERELKMIELKEKIKFLKETGI
ncbi:MAG: histidine kinase N-terminal 7TM domain-containing protein, partial [Candidatus Margulisiibacteriota bacterium]